MGMINLLPPDRKQELRSARVNVILRRYVMFEIIGIVLLGAITAGTYFIMDMTRANAEQEIADNQLRASDYSDAETRATQFRNNLSTAKGILDKEVRYSQVVLKIAQSIPDGIVLDTLTLDASTFGTPTSLTARAKSYQDSLRLKSEWEKSDVFDNVYLESVTRSTDSDSDYPVEIRINVTINTEVKSS